MHAKKFTVKFNDYRAIAIGCSAGGLKALTTIFSGISPKFEPPIIVVQHRGKDPSNLLVQLIRGVVPSSFSVREVEDKMPIETHSIYIAPSDYHLLATYDFPNREPYFSLSSDPKVQYSRPSIDVTLTSVAHVYGSEAIGIILTGANNDGAAGLAEIKKNGGLALVQDPKTASSPQMPMAAIAKCEVDVVVALDQLRDLFRLT